MGPYLILVETGALTLLHNELAAGAPGDVAVRTVLSTLESKITNSVERTLVTDVLNAIVNTVEGTIAATTPAA